MEITKDQALFIVDMLGLNREELERMQPELSGELLEAISLLVSCAPSTA